MAGLIVSAVAKWNGTALKKGRKDLYAFEKAAHSLGKTFLQVFAAQKIYQFGKASVKAFAADEKAAKSLEVALKNTGNSFATIATEGFISRMQQTYKVLDDELRPAFQTLLTATSSLTASQQGLELALNVSKGTGKDVQTVALALAKAYSGQTTALSKLGAGISSATIKSGDMKKILAELTAKFQGQALAATKTYQGQMDALAVSAQNVKEIIGKGLLDSLSALGGNNGIATATAEMEKFAQSTSDALLGLSTLFKNFKESDVGFALSVAFGAFMNSGILASIGKKERAKNQPISATSQYFTVETAERAKLIETIKKGNAAEKAKAKLTMAELDAKKKSSELDELKKKFDVNRINLETALLNSKDDAEKARIRSLLTIMDDDANSAAKRLAELDAANAAKMKAETAAADNLKYLAQEANRAALGLASIGNPKGSYGYTAANPSFVFGAGNMPSLPSDMSNAGDVNAPIDYGYTAASPSFTYSPPQTNYITIEAPNGSEEYLTDAVKRAMQKLNRYGDSTTFAGAL